MRIVNDYMQPYMDVAELQRDSKNSHGRPTVTATNDTAATAATSQMFPFVLSFDYHLMLFTNPQPMPTGWLSWLEFPLHSRVSRS